MHFIICQLITHENSYFLKEAAAYLYEHFQLFFLFVSKFFLFAANQNFPGITFQYNWKYCSIW